MFFVCVVCLPRLRYVCAMSALRDGKKSMINDSFMRCMLTLWQTPEHSTLEINSNFFYFSLQDLLYASHTTFLRFMIENVGKSAQPNSQSRKTHRLLNKKCSTAFAPAEFLFRSFANICTHEAEKYSKVLAIKYFL